MTQTHHRHLTRWPQVEGYCDRQSYLPGETVAVSVASRARTFAVEVARVGAQRTVVWARRGLRADDHPVPDQAWAVGCQWPVAFELHTDPSWPSGFYEVRLVGDEGDGGEQSVSEAFFVLTASDGGHPDRALLVLSTNTWQAYNQWGGRCFYSGADRVSFARPLERGYLRRRAEPDGGGFDGRVANVARPSDPEHLRLQAYQAANVYPLWSASSGWHNWERRFVQWAEAAGFGLDYAVNADLDGPDRAQEILGDHRLLVTVGHDEYWTWGMRDAVDHWVTDGGNWAVFSGNTCFWQVRYDDSAIICHRGQARTDDPVLGTERQHLLTSMWSDPLIGRPETHTTGLTFSRGGYHRIGQAVPNGAGAYTVHRPEHWTLAGTGLRYGDQLGADAGVVGYEVDGCMFQTVDGLPRATGADGAPLHMDIIATCPARLISITDEVCEAPTALWASVEPPGDLESTAMILFGPNWPQRIDELGRGHAVLASFSSGKGTIVNAGSADWAYGLDTDQTVQAVTANILRRLLG